MKSELFPASAHDSTRADSGRPQLTSEIRTRWVLVAAGHTAASLRCGGGGGGRRRAQVDHLRVRRGRGAALQVGQRGGEAAEEQLDVEALLGRARARARARARV